MKTASEMRSGMTIRLDGVPYRVVHAEYHAGGGKMHGAVHAKLKNLESHGLTERRFRQEERFEEIEVERQTMEYLYDEGDLCIFMHPETYEQMGLPKERLGAFLRFLQPNRSVQVELLEGRLLEVICPSSVELKVETTPEALHIENSSVLKNAVLENGLEVQVPQFIKEGDTVRIEVESAKYLERVR
jgi:elongation factor P